MQGEGFSFRGDYSNFSPFYTLEDQIQKYVSPKPLTRSFKDFSFTQQNNNLSLTGLSQRMNISFELNKE
jgi:hypothetical protein